MWDLLIVLGQIPGTNFQITFYEIVFAVLAGIATYLIYRRSAVVRRYVKAYYLVSKARAKSARKAARRQHKTGQKYLAAFKRRMRAKSPIKNLRGIPAAKLHARQRIA